MLRDPPEELAACCGSNTPVDTSQAEEEVLSSLFGLWDSSAPYRYRQAKRRAAMASAETKTRAWEEFGETMENDFGMASKRF